MPYPPHLCLSREAISDKPLAQKKCNENKIDKKIMTKK